MPLCRQWHCPCFWRNLVLFVVALKEELQHCGHLAMPPSTCFVDQLLVQSARFVGTESEQEPDHIQPVPPCCESQAAAAILGEQISPGTLFKQEFYGGRPRMINRSHQGAHSPCVLQIGIRAFIEQCTHRANMSPLAR